MIKTRFVLLLVTAIAFLSAGVTDADQATEVAGLHTADDAWATAYNGGDVDAVTALYDEHAVLLPPGAPAAVGRPAIRGFFAKDIAESARAGIRFILAANPAGGVSGSMGWSSGSYTLKDKSGKVLEAGKYLSVSKKLGGRWLYVRDTWNADAPPPTAEAPAPKK
jgi:ketosteroid isomerase-like protein